MKKENIKGEYQRKVDKSLIPTCNIMGVNIAAINMKWLLDYLEMIRMIIWQSAVQNGYTKMV